jgi:hypothetical protein
VRDNTDGAVEVEADLDAFPLLPGLALEGEVERLTVTLRELTGQEVTFVYPTDWIAARSPMRKATGWRIPLGANSVR